MVKYTQTKINVSNMERRLSSAFKRVGVRKGESCFIVGRTSFGELQFMVEIILILKGRYDIKVELFNDLMIKLAIAAGEEAECTLSEVLTTAISNATQESNEYRAALKNGKPVKAIRDTLVFLLNPEQAQVLNKDLMVKVAKNIGSKRVIVVIEE